MSKELMKIPGRNYEIETEPLRQFGTHRNYYEQPGTPHRRVFKPGRKIRSMDSLSRWLDAGGFTFWGSKPRALHASWVRGFQIGYVMWRLKAGQVRKAVRI